MPLKKNPKIGPCWCDSVDWALARKPRGRWFNSQPGHMPALPPSGGVWEATDRWIAYTLMFPSLPLFLKKEKKKEKEKKKPKIYGQISEIKFQSHMTQTLNKILAFTDNP